MNKYRWLRLHRDIKGFKEEHRKELRLFIIVTLSFTIAFTWRQTIFDVFQSLIYFFVEIKSSTWSSILTSILITIVSIALIRLTSHILKKSPDEH
jgi:hypothetical protein